MPSKTILCIGSPQNLHIQEVEKHIKALDKQAKMVIFNLERESDVIIEINTDGNEPSNSCAFMINGERILAEEITSVWFYPRPLEPPEREDVQGKLPWSFLGVLSTLTHLQLESLCVCKCCLVDGKKITPSSRLHACKESLTRVPS